MTEDERHLKYIAKENKKLSFSTLLIYAVVIWFMILQTWLIVRASDKQYLKAKSEAARAQYLESR
jgi:hypothetical protein